MTLPHPLKMECDQTTPQLEEEEEEGEILEEFAIEFMRQDLESDSAEIYDNVVEQLFYINGGNSLDFLNWKKRVPESSVVSSIVQMFQLSQQPNSAKDFLFQLLHSSGRISDLSAATASLPTHHLHPALPSTYLLNSSAVSISHPNASPISIHSVNNLDYSSPAISEFATKAATSTTGVSLPPTPLALVPTTPTVQNAAQPISALSTPTVTPAPRQPSRSGSMLEEPAGTREQIVEQAKQEAYVMQRIAELRKNGVWFNRRLPKVQEPPRSKVHWDYLLEEMQWLAADFLQERKWKRNSAKKCSKMVLKYHSLKECQAERVEKEEQAKLKRIASNIAKMVKQFWSEIEKLIEFKQEVQLKEKRKKIHDMQLRFIVDKADHFTEKLAQEFVTPSLKNSRAPSVDSEQSNDELDTERHSKTANKSIAELLKKESEMPIEELADSLPQKFVEDLTSKEEAANEHDDDDVEFEFEKGTSCSDDDEETIAKEEDQEEHESVDHKDELNELASEAEIPIEDLLTRYGYGNETPPSDEKTDYTTADDDETENNDSEDSDDSDEEDEDEEADDSGDIGLDYLVNTNNKDASNGSDQTGESEAKAEITEAIAAAAAESIQPKGNTLSSVEVITKVPFLLKFQLREYQHIGLDWLVAMYEKNLNGILADEMGLGKTIQTISLIAHLACEKGIWGPHLIVVPTSVMLNWEMELKKWCPALKILTYYGNPKERRIKRKGWTKPNTFHVCITSYKLVVQDHASFRRKKWVYFILDEAQHIKNFKSQRWQMLLNFNSTRRLLLTGTPLQNNLMELWSLMHFLMPNVFQSHREFKDWFVNPVTGMIEGNQENDEIIRRLHKILRPFLLRRLKCDVEKQLPKKYEHIVQCSLSKRQRQLYDEYMSMGKTKETLASGNFLSVINILMQLRKVCNHPNLFEPRPTVSPFIDQEIVYCIPALVSSIFDYHPLSQIDLQTLNLVFLHLSTTLSHSNQSDIKKYQYNLKGMETAWSSEPQVYARISDHAAFFRMINRTKPPSDCNANNVMMRVVMVQNSNNNISKLLRSEPEHKLTPLSNNNSFGRKRPLTEDAKIISKNDLSVNSANQSKSIDDAPASKVRLILESANCDEGLEETPKEGTLGVGKYAMHETITRIAELKRDKLRQMSLSNKRRCSLTAFYTKDFIGAARFTTDKNSDWSCAATKDDGRPLFSSGRGFDHCFLSRASHLSTNALNEMLHTPETLENSLHAILDRFLCIVPNVLASPIKLNITHLPSYKKMDECNFVQNLSQQLTPQFFDVIQIPRIQLRFQLPELRLIQYDCGKLHVLDHLLWRLKSQKHRVLIFTQMSRMLDIFEQFLNYHGHTYLRLDGSTKIEQRHALMERFNSDQRIFCFILSTRSGGVGVNLTGADTVIFYDSDWNPTMDAQAQDRCHRIGQTRDVHIYRLVSERTVEENILRKAQQKKLLGDLAIEEGNFTTAFFKQAAIRELFDVDQSTDPASDSTEVVVSSGVQVGDSLSPAAADSNSAEAVTNSSSLRSAFEQALCTAEEDTDVAAAKEVRAEAAAEFIEFDENIPIEEVSEEKSPEEEEIERALSNLSAVERYAVKFFESQKDFQELKQAEEEIEETKKQWQKSIKEWRMNHEEERRKALIEYQDSIMTVTREDASMEKVFMSINGLEPMPIWAPPTPPQDENDLYIDYSLGFLYEQTLMPESQLPPIYIPKEHKRIRVDVPALPHGRKHLQPSHAANTQALTPSHAGPLNTKSNRRPDDLYTIPKSPFDRSTSFIIRFRRELLIMKMKLWPGSANLISSIQRTFANMGSSAFPQSNIASVQSLAKAHFNMKHYPRWLIHEEFSIIMVLIYLQDLPYNLSIICPGHIPNWDLVAEQVNTYNSFKRSMKFCKYHFESVLAAKNDPNHMGDDTPKTPLQSHLLSAKQSKSNKKSKNQQGQSVLNQQQTNSFQSSSASQTITLNPSMPVNATSLGAAGNKGLLNSPMASGNMAVPSPSQPLYRMANILQNMVADNNMEFTNEMNKRFDVIKQIVIQKTQTSKSRFIKKHQPKTFDHVSLLMTEYQIKYDKPLSVEEVAAIRAERISKDKQAAREQQVREAQQAQHINQMKAYLQGTASTPPAPQFHSAPINTMASPSVMTSNSVAHIQQQQQSQSSASSAPHMQQQQQPTSSTGGLSQNINTPKHIIIGHPASLVGQSTAVVSTSSRNAGVASPALLQQVVSNQGSNNSNQQTRTFAIRTAYGHQIPAQPQPGTVYLSPLTLKTAASTGVSAQHNNQVKAFLQGTTSTSAAQFHSTPITISSPSVMATVTGMASNSVAHVQQQQQQQQQQQVQQPPANSVPLMQQQPQQQSTSTTNSLSQSINTPKHIIIRHPASLVGQSTAVVSTSSRNAGVASPALLQQVVSNQGSNNSSQQTRTFAIRTAYGHQIPAQPQPGTVYLSPLTLKTATSTTVSAQHSNQVKAFLQGTTSTSAAQFHSTPITISSPSVMATVSGMAANSVAHVQQQQQSQPSVNSPQMQQQQQQQSTSTTSSLPQSIATPKHIIIGHPNFIQ